MLLRFLLPNLVSYMPPPFVLGKTLGPVTTVWSSATQGWTVVMSIFSYTVKLWNFLSHVFRNSYDLPFFEKTSFPLLPKLVDYSYSFSPYFSISLALSCFFQVFVSMRFFHEWSPRHERSACTRALNSSNCRHKCNVT